MNQNEGPQRAATNEPIADDKGPTETLRDDAKSDAGKLMPEETAVPGVQKPGNEEIKEERGPNTE